MQSYGLTVDKFLEHAARWFGDKTIVGASGGAVQARTSYADVYDRSNRMSGALESLDLEAGDRLATLAWNTPHHFEIYFAAMGAGIVCHTLNPRFSVDHLVAIVNEAEGRALAVSADLAPLAAQLLPQCRSIEHVIILDGKADAGTGAVQFETLLRERGRKVAWGEFDENAPAGLCYTSGTTDKPKGVLYTHRSNYLHTLRALQADVVALTADDVLLLAVPMFHANGWGLPFAAPAVGSTLVLPGRDLDGASLARLIREESVTIAVGVQSVWLGLADHVQQTGDQLPSLKRVLIGGSSCPDSLLRRLEQVLGAEIQTSWGMTELSPIGTMAPPGRIAGLPRGSGRPAMGLNLKLTDATGATLPKQRGVQGHLKVKGHSVVDRYYGAEQPALDKEGYFDTGDLAMIDEAGFVTICGRSKDLIKSGGEWINPTEIEAIVGMHPRVRHVAVIARDDAKWGERPVMVVECEEDLAAIDPVGLLRGKVPDWWLPSDVVQVEQIPLSASGKIDKRQLRADFAAGQLTAQAVTQ
ncbi:AMP-binding protein [Sphingomonas alba]|uniref:AMP-binding protein n=1 Tax=Sphingomonas alba TaxID=2908208 RepID=A0ABT0RKL4_9SPHN|nr:AMP-binding protein [Sphingomonas alba]MCL6683178.1 AMP-binding protein [Sphingomonas alba]